MLEALPPGSLKFVVTESCRNICVKEEAGIVRHLDPHELKVPLLPPDTTGICIASSTVADTSSVMVRQCFKFGDYFNSSK